MKRHILPPIRAEPWREMPTFLPILINKYNRKG